MLGPGKHDLYKQGKLTLADLVGERHDPTWGKSRYQKSLRDLDVTGVAEQKKKKKQAGANRSAEYSIPAKPFIAPSQQGLRAVRIEEDRIRTQRFESAYAVDRVEKELLKKDGGKRSVDITIRERAEMRGHTGVVFTHNHPIGWGYTSDDPRHQGNSFTFDDIKLACLAQLSEIRAVTPTRRFWMRPAKEGWNGDYWYDILLPVAEKADRAVHNEHLAQIIRGETTKAEAEAKHWHEVWLRVTKKLRLGYGIEDD